MTSQTTPSTRFRFTEARVKDLPCPTTVRQVRYHDEVLPGYALRVTAGGAKTLSIFRRFQGKTVDVTIGRWPTITVEDGRRQAQKLLCEMAQGINPTQAKRNQQQEPTLRERFQSYQETQAKRRKRTWATDQRWFDLYLAPFHARTLSAITSAEVIDWHARVGQENGPVIANRAHGLLRRCFRIAAKRGWTGNNDPTRGVEPFREFRRDRFLDGDELTRFWLALDPEPEDLKTLFTVALLTGARKANLLAMRWADVDIARGLWRIPPQDSKTGNPLTVILAPAVITCLTQHRERQQESGPNGQWVFPSGSSAGHRMEPAPALRRILQRAGVLNVRFHDLRRTHASWQAILGASLPIIGKALGHSKASTTEIYARLTMTPVQESVERAVEAMLKMKVGPSAPIT